MKSGPSLKIPRIKKSVYSWILSDYGHRKRKELFSLFGIALVFNVELKIWHWRNSEIN